MSVVALVYPHQLYAHQPALEGANEVWLVEDPLFFSQYRFHRQKLIYHRATMSEYAEELRGKKRVARRIEADALDLTGDVAPLLKQAGVTQARVVDPNDDWLSRRLRKACEEQGIGLEVIPDANFLTDDVQASEWLGDRKRYFFTEFYIHQRKALDILIEPDGGPTGGKWTFDTENRKRLPSGTLVPRIAAPASRLSVTEAEAYARDRFPYAIGDPNEPMRYAVTREDAQAWMKDFLDERLYDFGAYEDAISTSEATLFHSVLTPALNVGLLTPGEIVHEALKRRDEVPLNSLEGFLRQVIGWREFVRLMYRRIGRSQRSVNALGHDYPLPAALYAGSTGIAPVDTVVKRVLRTGYCHHIERLMVLGNFMTLIEVHPDEVYRWFMEMFIDAYDWVMVPNVYGMSQYADGGRITTKPYVSGSNYLLKMSDYLKGEWCEIWDGLYWRFVDKRRALFSRNPRLSLAVKTLDRMGSRADHLIGVANDYLQELHGSRDR